MGLRLVVSGYIGHGNAGDEWVLAGLFRSLDRVEPGASVVAISGDPPETRATHGVDAVSRTDVAGIIRAIRASDGLISGGGSLLQDVTSSRPVAYYAGIMLGARALGRPYAVHAQGLGPIRLTANRWLAAAALRGAASVSLRDPDSIALARSLGVRRPIAHAPDPAVALRPDAVSDASSGRPLVVALRPWPSSDAIVRAVRAALGDLAPDMPVLALPLQETVDRSVAEALVDRIPNATVLPPDATLADRLAALASARVVVGMRLHALVLAAASDVPFVAISYDPKVTAFAELVGQPVAANVGDEPDAADIASAVRAALSADGAPYRARVAELRTAVDRSTADTVAAIRGTRPPS